MKQLHPLRLLVAALSLLTAGCNDGPHIYGDTFAAFGTQVEVSLTGVGKEQAEAAIRTVELDLQQMDQAWSAWKPSPLVHINQMFRLGRTNFHCPEELRPAIEIGRKLALQSDHLFNPAIGDLIAAWGFHSDTPEKHAPPAQQEIDRLLAGKPQMDSVYFNGPRVSSVNPAVQLDLRAFAKGYALDMAIGKLLTMGIPAARVDARGKLRAYGSVAAKPWQAAIRDPFTTGSIAHLQIRQDEAIITTDDSEGNYQANGKRIHPIIDPRTGYPANGVRSVTVIHPDATTADAASTALFVAGTDGWYPVARRMGIRYVLLIDDKGGLHMNPEMKERLELDRTGLQTELSAPLTDTAPSAAPAIAPGASSAG